jgi:hypothetical protein
MLRLIKLDRTYGPETIAVMTAAFDRVCRSVSPSVRASRERLALIILRHVDQGERDVQRLADIALREWMDATRLETVEGSATG